MREKNILAWTLSLSIVIFCLALIFSLLHQLKVKEFEFNERKAVLIKENLSLKESFASLEKTISQNEGAMAALEKEKESIEKNLTSFKEENEKLKIEFAEHVEILEMENTSLNQRIKELEEKPLEMHLREALYKEENKDARGFLERMLYNLELIKSGKSIELEPIVVEGKPETAPPVPEEKPQELPDMISEKIIPSGKEAEVLSVDKKYNLLVVNLGRKDNIQKGEQCIILKDDKKIATARVISTRHKVSAAFVDEIKSGYSIDDIKEGDKAIILAL